MLPWVPSNHIWLLSSSPVLSLSFSLSLALAHSQKFPLTPSTESTGRFPPELNESMCHVKAGYYSGTPGGAAVGQGRRPEVDVSSLHEAATGRRDGREDEVE